MKMVETEMGREVNLLLQKQKEKLNTLTIFLLDLVTSINMTGGLLKIVDHILNLQKDKRVNKSNGQLPQPHQSVILFARGFSIKFESALYSIAVDLKITIDEKTRNELITNPNIDYLIVHLTAL